MDRDEVRADLPAVRKAELDQAAEIIGYDEVVMLGYRDSGMPDSEANARPEAFANADFDEAVGRLVAEIRRTRPQVVITYGAEQQGYPQARKSVVEGKRVSVRVALGGRRIIKKHT